MAKKQISIRKKGEELWQLHQKMVLIRRFEEATIKAYQQKKIAGFLHTYIGTEGVGVGLLAHKQIQDSVITSYRCHGLGLALGLTPESCMAELFGKVTGCARGKGGSMHYFSKEHNFLGGHGIVGGQFGPGIGAAFASKYKEENGVSFIFFGDGAIPQGSFHETINLASLWDLPAIFICEDNQYAMGTANSRILSNTNVSEIAKSYNIKGYTLDGMSLCDVYDQSLPIVEEVRKNQKPVLIHAVTYRYKGHSVSDAAKYRTKEEEKEWKEKDPIIKSVNRLQIEGIKSAQEIEAHDKKVKNYIKDVVKYAEKSPEPPLSELTTHVFKEHLEDGLWQ